MDYAHNHLLYPVADTAWQYRTCREIIPGGLRVKYRINDEWIEFLVSSEEFEFDGGYGYVHWASGAISILWTCRPDSFLILTEYSFYRDIPGGHEYQFTDYIPKALVDWKKEGF